ncbi:hypothetical protein SESBI_27849 [Sesbania bispinosa]|nr:hypothetical protein SESBI_27849 [Sesbania bispinosa]
MVTPPWTAAGDAEHAHKDGGCWVQISQPGTTIAMSGKVTCAAPESGYGGLQRRYSTVVVRRCHGYMAPKRR